MPPEEERAIDPLADPVSVNNNNNNGLETDTLCDDWLEHELTADAQSFVNIVAPRRSSATTRGGSTVLSAVFNFTNCIVGAGCIGLGGALARSGGLISIVTVVFFAFLVKKSLDLVIQLSLNVSETCSYEDLGYASYGTPGRLLVSASKFAYSFGCMVAYVVVINDNLSTAVQNLTGSDAWIFEAKMYATWLVSVVIILPLCMLRDMTPLAFASVVSVAAMVFIVVIVIYLWWIGVGDEFPRPVPNATTLFLVGNDTSSDTDNANTETTGSFYEHWLEIRWLGYLSNLGTFIFTFVCHHTVHLAFTSLRPDIRDLMHWKKVSLHSMASSCTISLTIGVFVYASFWERTESDVFEIYPNSTVLDMAKMLLCITMMLTFPLPFFSCRELLIAFCFSQGETIGIVDSTTPVSDLEAPLLPRNDALENDDHSRREQEDEDGEVASPEEGDREAHGDTSLASSADGLLRQESSLSLLDMSAISARARDTFLLEDDPKQLKLPYHLLVTGKLWIVATGLAIAAPNLGDVLDLVGCVSGTLIAFILPALFSFKLKGYSHLGAVILVVGGVIGSVGTFYSLLQFVNDLKATIHN